MTISDKALKTIRRYNLISQNDKIVVGVSGGPDSLALLYILNSLKDKLKITLQVAHLDHMLRKDSSRDCLFVEKLARKLGLPVTYTNINVKAIARRGSIEEIARNARLGFLFRVARQVNADKIALGHNLDDQAETVLMRIIRGSGLQGLSGISAKREICGYQIIRPLIEIKRKEIEAFLKRRNIKPVRDVSNSEDIYFRNKIRHRLLPLLEREYNRNIKEVLSNAAQGIGYDYDYLNEVARSQVKRLGKRISLAKFLDLHPAIQRLVLRLRIAGLKGDMRAIGSKHLKEIEDLIFNRPANSIVDLPKGISVIKKKKYISFYRRRNNQ